MPPCDKAFEKGSEAIVMWVQGLDENSKPIGSCFLVTTNVVDTWLAGAMEPVYTGPKEREAANVAIMLIKRKDIRNIENQCGSLNKLMVQLSLMSVFRVEHPVTLHSVIYDCVSTYNVLWEVL